MEVFKPNHCHKWHARSLPRRPQSPWRCCACKGLGQARGLTPTRHCRISFIGSRFIYAFSFMSPASTPPSHLLRFLSTAVRWFFRLLVVFWALVLVAAAVLHWAIIPRLPQWQPEIEAFASRALGARVAFSRIESLSNGLIPAVRIHGMHLEDAQGQTVLQAPEITLAVSLRSLWRGGLEQLVVEHADIRVERDGAQWRVAGQTIGAGGRGDNAQAARAIDWLLRQPELALQDAQVTLSDASGAAPQLRIAPINVVLRSHGQTNEMQLRVAPEVPGTAPLEFRAKLHRPLLSFSDSLWPLWSGQSWLEWGSTDLAAWAPYIPLFDPAASTVAGLQGQARVRAWMQWQSGWPSHVTLDVGLVNARAQWRGAALPLDIAHLSARLNGQKITDGWDLSSQGLAFATGSGLQWQQGDWQLRYETPVGAAQPQTTITATHADLGALAQLLKFIPWSGRERGAAKAPAAQRPGLAAGPALPMAAPEMDLGEQLARWQPSGQVENFHLRLSGPWAQWGLQSSYALGATLRNVRFGMANAWLDGRQVPATPLGVEGLSGAINLTEKEGSASIEIDQGRLRLPTEFEAPIALDRLRAKARWSLAADGQVQLWLDDVQAANADAQGVARLHWRTFTDAEMALYQNDPKWAGKRLPGVLDLEAKLTRANGAQTYKYLPLSIPEDARHYVKEAIVQASSNNVDFWVKGDLHRFPYASAEQVQQAERQGVQERFRIAASVTNVRYRYLPHYLLHDAQVAWPDLTDAQADLVFEGNSMVVTVHQSSLGGDPRLQVQPGSRATIADFHDTVVEVQAQAHGPLQNQLNVLRNSPAAGYSGHVLDAMKATGNARLSLDLRIPVHDTLRGLKVKGGVALNGNNLQWLPDVPALDDVRGTVHFSDTKFWFDGIAFKALGGQSVVSARMQDAAHDKPVQVEIKAEGQLSAQGLQKEAPGPVAQQLAQHLSGQTDYTAVVNTVGERVFFDIQSNLQGLASDLPAPLHKTAQAAMPLRIHSQALGENEALDVGLGDVVQARYLLRAAQGDQPRQSTGNIWVGDFSEQEKSQAPVNADFNSRKSNAVWAFIRLADLDAQAWYAAIAGAQSGAAPTAAQPQAARSVAEAPLSAHNLLYWPSASRWEVEKLHWEARSMNHVRMQLRHENPQSRQWTAAIRSQEVVGDLDYFPPAAPEAKGNAAGLLKARLAYLELPSENASAAAAEAPAEPAAPEATAVKDLPALDLDIERLLLAQRDWGHVQLQAVNLGPVAAAPGGEAPAEAATPNETEWRINRLSVEVPEAQLHATGNWKVPQTGYPLALLSGSKRTALDFKLEINDASRLLARLGMPNILRGGSGSIVGNLGWVGPPVKLDYPSLSGQFKLRIDKGQLLKADAGVGRLLGVLSLQALPRRIVLDFRDIFSEGFAFDFVQGDFNVTHGVIETNNLQMKGVNAAVIIEGSANVVDETQNIRALVVPEINTMTAALVATAINPAVGAGAFLAQLFLGKPLSKAATREFQVQGAWSDPKVEQVPLTQED